MHTSFRVGHHFWGLTEENRTRDEAPPNVGAVTVPLCQCLTWWSLRPVAVACAGTLAVVTGRARWQTPTEAMT